MLDNTPNQPSKFWTKNWVDINDKSYKAINDKAYDANNDIKFKTSMTSLCDDSDAYIHVKGTTTITGTAAALNNAKRKVIFENCTPFTNCISKINNKQIDYANDIDAVMPKYNLIEYSDIYSKLSGSLWQYS